MMVVMGITTAPADRSLATRVAAVVVVVASLVVANITGDTAHGDTPATQLRSGVVQCCYGGW